MPVRAGYLIASGAGIVLLWSGVKGHKWSAVLKDVLSGAPVPTTPELGITSSSAAMSGGTGPNTGAGPSLGLGGSAAKNKAIAKIMTARFGWSTGAQWAALDALWTQESGWDNKAVNSSSGATGIPQALPATKMPKVAQAPIYSASAQIWWGLEYIKGRYGNPVAAEAHERANNWY